jgi:sensor histidine kinase YesM
MIVGATVARDYYVKLRESELLASELGTKLAEAQLQALKMQLQPHFLFNTHHSIIALMLRNETTPAIKMLTRLSDLLRITLQRNHQQLTSLKEELDALDLYLGIQKERYRERLQVVLDIEPALLGAEVPSLLLQPLVENAIKHGIDALPGVGVLAVKAWRAEKSLRLSVCDNGPGLRERSDLPNSGFGLSNTRSRLQRLYGSEHSFEIISRDGSGAEVNISIPFRPFSPPGEEGAESGTNE